MASWSLALANAGAIPGVYVAGLGQNLVKKLSNNLAVRMKEFLSGVIYWYDAALESSVTLSGHGFWFMPPLIAIIYYFRCGSNKEPQAEEEILVLVTA